MIAAEGIIAADDRPTHPTPRRSADYSDHPHQAANIHAYKAGIACAESMRSEQCAAIERLPASVTACASSPATARHRCTIDPSAGGYPHAWALFALTTFVGSLDRQR